MYIERYPAEFWVTALLVPPVVGILVLWVYRGFAKRPPASPTSPPPLPPKVPPSVLLVLAAIGASVLIQLMQYRALKDSVEIVEIETSSKLDEIERVVHGVSSDVDDVKTELDSVKSSIR